MSYPIVYGLVVGTIVLGGVSLLVCGYVLAEAFADRRALRIAGIGNGRRLVARRAVYAEAARTAATACLVGGLVALLVGQAPQAGVPIAEREPVSLAIFLTLALYGAGVTIIALDAVSALISRRRLDAELASHHRALSAAPADGRTQEDDHGL